MTTLYFNHSKAYGRDIFTPTCPTGRLFAKLLGQRSLSAQNLAVLAELGYQIKLKHVVIG